MSSSSSISLPFVLLDPATRSRGLEEFSQTREGLSRYRNVLFVFWSGQVYGLWGSDKLKLSWLRKQLLLTSICLAVTVQKGLIFKALSKTDRRVHQFSWNRKRFSWYRIIEIRSKVWENLDTSRRRDYSGTAFQVVPDFYECCESSAETYSVFGPSGPSSRSLSRFL